MWVPNNSKGKGIVQASISCACASQLRATSYRTLRVANNREGNGIVESAEAHVISHTEGR